MQAQAGYRRLLREHIGPNLKLEGFSQSGQDFYLCQSGNGGIINLQKSQRSTAEEVVFTINLGIASSRLLEFFRPGSSRRKPVIEDCHWRKRLGFLLPENEDKWWIIDSETALEELGEQFRTYLRYQGVPHILSLIGDEALRDLWLSGDSPGLTDLQRLLNLSALVRMIGPVNRLQSSVEELRELAQGKPSAVLVESHIQRLECGSPE